MIVANSAALVVSVAVSMYVCSRVARSRSACTQQDSVARGSRLHGQNCRRAETRQDNHEIVARHAGGMTGSTNHARCQ